MKRTAPAFLSLALLLFGDMARAQDLVEAEKIRIQSWAEAWSQENSEPWSKFVLDEALLRTSDDPSLKSALALPQPKLTLTLTDDGKTQVKARIGLEMTSTLIGSLEVESPKSGSGDTTLANLDGLSKGTRAKLSLSWFPQSPPAFSPQEIQEVLGEAAQKAGIGDNPTNTKLIKAYAESNAWGPSPVAVMGGLEMYKAVVSQCQQRLGKKDWFIPILTVNATAAQKQFHFVAPTTLKKGDESHKDWQLTASTGAYLGGKAYAALTYNQGKAFAAGRTANICAPFGQTSALECGDVNLGAPAKQTTKSLEFEIRRLFGSLGTGARLTRDLQANITFVEVPIYVQQKMGATDMELNGGISLKWRSDTKTYSVVAFIGPALSKVVRMTRNKRPQG